MAQSDADDGDTQGTQGTAVAEIKDQAVDQAHEFEGHRRPACRAR